MVVLWQVYPNNTAQCAVRTGHAQDGDRMIDRSIGIRVVPVAGFRRRAAIHGEPATGVAVGQRRRCETVERPADEFDQGLRQRIEVLFGFVAPVRRSAVRMGRVHQQSVRRQLVVVLNPFGNRRPQPFDHADQVHGEEHDAWPSRSSSASALANNSCSVPSAGSLRPA